MRITVLDGYEANPGDISWEPLMQLGETTIYDETPPDQVIARLKGQDVLVLNRIRVDEALLSQLPDLKMITTLATGYNQIDLAATSARGIPVCNVPAYCTEAVSQFTWALILEMANHVGAHSQLVHQGQYEQSRDAVYSTLPFLELTGLKLGIFGYGEIGQRVAELGLAFGMQVLLHSRTQKPAPHGCRWVDEETLFRESDIPEEITHVLGHTKSERINTLVTSIVKNSIGDIKMDDTTAGYYDMLHSFLFESVYKNPVAKSEETKVSGIVEGLLKYYKNNALKMPPEYLAIAENEGLERAITDYIAGMTDHYAITVYSDIYIPKAWSI